MCFGIKRKVLSGLRQFEAFDELIFVKDQIGLASAPARCNVFNAFADKNNLLRVAALSVRGRVDLSIQSRILKELRKSKTTNCKSVERSPRATLHKSPPNPSQPTPLPRALQHHRGRSSRSGCQRRGTAQHPSSNLLRLPRGLLPWPQSLLHEGKSRSLILDRNPAGGGLTNSKPALPHRLNE